MFAPIFFFSLFFFPPGKTNGFIWTGRNYELWNHLCRCDGPPPTSSGGRRRQIASVTAAGTRRYLCGEPIPVCIFHGEPILMECPLYGQECHVYHPHYCIAWHPRGWSLYVILNLKLLHLPAKSSSVILRKQCQAPGRVWNSFRVPTASQFGPIFTLRPPQIFDTHKVINYFGVFITVSFLSYTGAKVRRR